MVNWNCWIESYDVVVGKHYEISCPECGFQMHAVLRKKQGANYYFDNGVVMDNLFICQIKEWTGDSDYDYEGPPTITAAHRPYSRCLCILSRLRAFVGRFGLRRQHSSSQG